MARRSRLTAATKKRIIDAIRMGATVADACLCAGITESTFYRWMREGEAASRGTKRQFYQAVEKARGEGRLTMLALISKHAKQDWRAAAWRLTNCAEGYEKASRVELTGPDGGSVRHAVAPDREALVAFSTDPEAMAAMAVLAAKSAVLQLEAEMDDDGEDIDS